MVARGAAGYLQRVLRDGMTATIGLSRTLALVPDLGGFLAGLVILGLGSGFLDVGPSAMIGDVLGGQGGSVVAAFQMSGDLGAISGPVVAGLLDDLRHRVRCVRTPRRGDNGGTERLRQPLRREALRLAGVALHRRPNSRSISASASVT